MLFRSWFIQNKPDEEKFMYLGYCYSMIGEGKKAMQAYYQAADMDPRKWQEAMDLVCKEASKLPAWDERALESISKEVQATARKGLKLVDPMFDGDVTAERFHKLSENGEKAAAETKIELAT